MHRGYMLALLAFFACGIVVVSPFKAQIAVMLFFSSIVAMALAWATRRIFVKYVCIFLFSVLFPLTLLEGYYLIVLNQADTRFEHTFKDTGEVFTEQSLAKRKKDIPLEIRSRRIINDTEVLYDVVYSLDEVGNRVTPIHKDANIAVAFLGCSFTFGDGLENEQTFPWQVSEKLGPKYQIFNFSRSGFGPNKVLANLQTNMQFLRKYERVLFFYTIIEDHPRRTTYGQRYVLENGLAVRKGNHEPQKLFGSYVTLEHWTNKSYLFKKIRVPLLTKFSSMGSEKDRIDLTYALIEAIQKEIQANFAKSTFTVLAWPPNAMEMLAELSKNITVIDVESWLPNYALEQQKKDSKYVLRPAVDSHPTAYANDLVSDALVKLILEKSKNFTQ